MFNSSAAHNSCVHLQFFVACCRCCSVVVVATATATATAVGVGGAGVGRHCYAGRVVKTPKTKAKPKSKREARGTFFLLLLLTRSQKRGAERASLYATISKRQLEREGSTECVCVCAECHTPGHEIDYSVSRHSITLRRRQLELARCPAKRRDNNNRSSSDGSKRRVNAQVNCIVATG